MHPLAQLDHRHVWHPFTQMRDWLKREPVVITSGRGTVLRDVEGRAYLDANSSIWTNLHGHNHPVINAAINRQLKRIAHSSALGLANEPASRLAARLVSAAATGRRTRPSARRGCDSVSHPLAKVFFSDDGSTAMEVALKLAYEFSRRARNLRRPRFLSLDGAYHGDTIGAVSVGQIDLFHRAYADLCFKTDRVMAPYCYRCPYNRARPERADAREYRQCKWECLDKLEYKFANRKRRAEPYAGFVFEPLIQGAAGMIPQPAGWLTRAAEIALGHGALLIADEVLTAFGRAASARRLKQRGNSILASAQEGVQPDFAILAKGLTGGYLPMAATMTTQTIFEAFLGEYEEFNAFFHGHSYTGNQIGAAAALASLEIAASSESVKARVILEQALDAELQSLWALPSVGDIRRVGLIAGVELVRDWRTREPLPAAERTGARVCDQMKQLGVLTRPIGNVIVLMPPYCATPAQVRRMVLALHEAIERITTSRARAGARAVKT